MTRFRSLGFLTAFALSFLWAGTASAAPPPKLFISCAQPLLCFDSYLRQELSYFDFVRDQYLADLTLVISIQPAGNGGMRFSVVLRHRDPTADLAGARTRSFVALPGATPQAQREELLQVILRVLQTDLIDTPSDDAFTLSITKRTGNTLTNQYDPWHHWVITPELLGYAEGASGYYSADLNSALTVRRITEPSKLRLRGTYGRRLSRYRFEDGESVSGDVYTWEGRAIYAHSVGERWAIGGAVTTRGSQFENLQKHVHGGPLLEFNIFPYTQNASKQLRFAYQAGAWANWYFEENEAGRMRQVKPYHALSLIADVNQSWGSVQWVGQVNSFLDDPELYRVSTGAILGIRLFRGLAVTMAGQAALVRDLIGLRRRPITDLELLLRTAQQRTDYTFELEFAVSYTFGSVYNTIVNPRFGRVDLDEE